MKNPHTDFLAGFVGLMLYWLVGELLVSQLGLGLPGPVAGMLLLLAVSMLRRRVAPAISHAGHGLLSHLSLLFVPAGVGIIDQASLLLQHGAGMIATLVLSTAVTLAVTALTLNWLLARRQKGRRHERAEH